LRRDYRHRLWNVLRRRPRIALLRVYVIKCALHFHFDRLIAQMHAERAKQELRSPRPFYSRFVRDQEVGTSSKKTPLRPGAGRG
jgi:hypothetical protein